MTFNSDLVDDSEGKRLNSGSSISSSIMTQFFASLKSDTDIPQSLIDHLIDLAGNDQLNDLDLVKRALIQAAEPHHEDH